MKQFNQINVIPFIDIMLVLLAIVLLTATFSTKEKLDLELPVADNSITLDNQQNVSISINADQKFYFDGQEIKQKKINEKLNSLKSQTPIVLSVDKSVPFDKFIFIIDLLKGKDLANLSIMVREP